MKGKFSIARFRWIIAALLLASTTLNYIDRMTLSVLIESVRRDLSFTEAEYGQIVSFFLFAYAIMYAGSGYIVDRLGTRRGFALFSFIWSLSQVLHGLVAGKWSLAACRSLLGLSEPGNFPAAVKAVGEWFPESQRALGVGIFNAGSSLGAALAAPLSAWVALHFGWRAAFVVTGTLGFCWLFFWLLFYQPPEKNRWLRTSERVAISDLPKPALARRSSWVRTLCSRACLTLMLMRFLSDPVIYFVIFWLPAYLEKGRGFSLAMIGRYGWVPFVFGDLGYIAGGWLSGWLIRRGWTLPKARKTAMAIGAALLPAAIAAPLVPSSGDAIAAMSLIVFGHAIWIANLLTLPADLFPEDAVGTATGFSGMAGSFGGILGNLATGYVVSHFSYRPIFIIAGMMHPISLGILFLLLPARKFQRRKIAV